MSDREYNALRIQEVERICIDHFHMNLPIDQLVIPDVPTLHDTYTSVFKSGRAMYALCEAETPIALREVRAIIKLMGMEAEAYFPPRNDSNYFMRFARRAFISVFPGRDVVNDNDLIYYQTLAPYSPALVRIRKINGQIREYNARGKNWQHAIDFSYVHPQVQLR